MRVAHPALALQLQVICNLLTVDILNVFDIADDLYEKYTCHIIYRANTKQWLNIVSVFG